jgi:hypothetical protein
MKNGAENLFKISFGPEAEKEAGRVLAKKNISEAEDSNPALDFVDAKLIANQLVPDFGLGMTYGMLFKLYREGESLPREIDDVIKFKRWYHENKDGNPDNPVKEAA